MKFDVLIPHASFEESANQLQVADLKRNMLAAARLLKLLLASPNTGRWATLANPSDFSDSLSIWNSYTGALCYYSIYMARRYAQLTGNERPIKYFQDFMTLALARNGGHIGLPNWRFWQQRQRASQTILFYATDFRAFKKACVRAHKTVLESNRRVHRRGVPVGMPSYREFARLQGWEFSQHDFPEYMNTVWHVLETTYRAAHPSNPYRSVGYCRTGRRTLPQVGRFHRE